jgi:hypothetical protein
MKRKTHQHVGSWGQKGRSGHQESLDFQTPFRLAHNYFIASSHRGEMLAPRLMALYKTFNCCRKSKKTYRTILTYVSGAKKHDPAIKNPLISTSLSASPTNFIATSQRGEMLAPRLMALYDMCNSSRMSKKAYWTI